jgi:hypothetical protein
VAATGTSTPSASTLLDFENYINAPGALNVVAIAYVWNNGGTITLSSGVNAARSYFGGSSTEDGYLELRIRDQASTASTAALINLSRQTHIVLRVITRDMDAGSNIRPDNV